MCIFGESSEMSFIEIHHHHYGSSQHKLEEVSQKLEIIMATLQSFKDVLTKQSDLIKNIAADVNGLIETINVSGITALEEDEVLAILQKQSDALTALAAIVPEAPAPDPVPDPVPG